MNKLSQFPPCKTQNGLNGRCGLSEATFRFREKSPRNNDIQAFREHITAGYKQHRAVSGLDIQEPGPPTLGRGLLVTCQEEQEKEAPRETLYPTKLDSSSKLI
jgi:hypothetical protein